MARTVRGVKTFDVDIAQEFRDLFKQNTELRQDFNDQNAGLRQEIQQLKESINGWKNTFERQLDKLNNNMEKVLQTLTNHELRLTELENKVRADQVAADTKTEMIRLGWALAKWVLAAGVIVGGTFGVGGVIKFLFGAA